jgi:hypothetical protein
MPTLAAGLRLHLRRAPVFGSSFAPRVEFRRDLFDRLAPLAHFDAAIHQPVITAQR